MASAKKTYTLRMRIILLMTVLVILQSLALVSSLAFSQVFSVLDAESYRLFKSTMNNRTQSFNSNVAQIVGNMSEEVTRLSQSLIIIAGTYGITPHDLYLEREPYTETALAGTDLLLKVLNNNNVSSAFFMINGSNANPDNGNAHSAVYIQNSAPGITSAGTANYQLEIGPITVSQTHQIATSVNWDLDIIFSGDNDPKSDIYFNPITAAINEPRAETARYGYWSMPIILLKDNQQMIYYTLPLLDNGGVPFGVIGIGISLAHFTQYYLPNTDLPYQNSFYAITELRDGALLMDWVIPSGPLASLYLKEGNPLNLKDAGSDFYELTLSNIGDMYCSLQPLTIYSRNSPFYEQGWTLVGLVPQSTLHETSDSVRSVLVFSIIATTAAAFAAIFMMAFLSTRKISGLSKYVKSLSPNQDIKFQRTGLSEIDDLTHAVATLNKSVIKASKTVSKILELTSMPIGGFEIPSDGAYVTLTEYIYTLLDIMPQSSVTKEEWDEHYRLLTAISEPDNENVYQFKDPKSFQPLWLRIITSKTGESHVGVILDITRDINEQRRLVRELDYDGLTQLYNRIAFKREAYKLIQADPDSVGVMIFSDLDNLKYTNDTFGHEIGDKLIISAGDMFREFQKFGGVISRISGDEFAVYIHGFKTINEAREIIMPQFRENERYQIELPNGSSMRIRSSSGIAWYPQDAGNVTDLLKLSDFAMYEAKHNRKGTIFEFSQKSYEKNAYLLDNRETINKLLDEGLIRFAYQPIVNLRTGEVFAYELLMRSLSKSFKSPLEIISVASAQSKLEQLERLVVMKAAEVISKHADALGDVMFFINSLPSENLSDEDHAFIEKNYGKYLDRIVVEVIEEEGKSSNKMNKKVGFVRDHKMLLAVDDFGSGYANEVRVLTMNPDIIKIDMSMIQGIHNDKDKQLLVKNLVSFCRPKNIRLVAEGVEEFEDLVMLRKLDIDFVQGYYLARPDFEFLDIPESIKEKIKSLQ